MREAGDGVQECRTVFCRAVSQADGLQNTVPRMLLSVSRQQGLCSVKMEMLDQGYTGSCVTGVLRTFNVQILNVNF